MSNRLFEPPDDDEAMYLDGTMVRVLLAAAAARLRGCPIGESYTAAASEFVEANPHAWFAPAPLAVDAVLAIVAKLGVDAGPEQVIRAARVMTLASGYAATAEANRMRLAAGTN